MRRHPALQDLSRDHHNVLVHARRLRGLDARIDAATARRRFLQYAEAVLLAHFDEEETVLGPKVEAVHRDRLLLEHASLRQAIARLPTSDDAAQKELGEALRLHVRFEEDVLFQGLQDHLGTVALDGLGDALAATRRKLRPTAGDGEACFL